MSLEQILGSSNEPDPEGHKLPGGYSDPKCTICGDCIKCWYLIIPNVSYSCCDNVECKKRCESMVLIELKKNYAYGPLYDFRDASIKVRRSNGDVEEDWKILCGGIIIISNIAFIKCTNIDSSLTKYVAVTDILELNKDKLNLST